MAKRICLGGFPEGYVCKNPAGCPHTPYWCKECNKKRMEHINQRLIGAETMADDHLHMYNVRGFCWCGAHRDDWLRDENMLGRIGKAFTKLADEATQHGPNGECPHCGKVDCRCDKDVL